MLGSARVWSDDYSMRLPARGHHPTCQAFSSSMGLDEEAEGPDVSGGRAAVPGAMWNAAGSVHLGSHPNTS